MLPQQWNNSVVQASLQQQRVAPEHYIELWWYSDSYSNNTSTASGVYALVKGNYGATALNTSSPAQKLYVLNASWPATTKFAFEAALWTASSSGYAALWDMTTNSIVSASQISATTSTATVIRSGMFTLTPGHAYGVTWWASTSSGASITDASLIAFPS